MVAVARKRTARKKAAPKKKPAPKKKASPKAGSDVDLATVELPKVGELVKFLAKFDDAKDIKALMKRDSRKTAQAHYEARLTELSGAAKGKKD